MLAQEKDIQRGVVLVKGGGYMCEWFCVCVCVCVWYVYAYAHVDVPTLMYVCVCVRVYNIHGSGVQKVLPF